MCNICNLTRHEKAVRYLFCVVTAVIMTVRGAYGITPVSQAESMAARAGEVVGAAAACGIPGNRLIAVGKTAIALVREIARSEMEVRKAQVVYERGAWRGEADVRRRGPSICPAVIRTFERAEAN